MPTIYKGQAFQDYDGIFCDLGLDMAHTRDRMQSLDCALPLGQSVLMLYTLLQD